MLRELDAESRKVGLKMNSTKTKYMISNDQQKYQIRVRNELIEQVDHYVYLYRLIKMDIGQKEESARRKKAG